MSDQQQQPSLLSVTPQRMRFLPSQIPRFQRDWSIDDDRQSSHGYIDLTAEPSTAMGISRLVRAPTPTQTGQRSPKRRRTGSHVGPFQDMLRSTAINITAPDQMDLTGVEDDAGLRKLQEEQRSRHAKLQNHKDRLMSDSIKEQRERENKPSRMSTLQCVVCMENMTNITATHCGHLFCHTCLMEALIAGENQESEPGKGLSRCPICRKKVNRPKGAKDPGHIIPLELKLQRKSEVARGKERATS